MGNLGEPERQSGSAVPDRDEMIAAIRDESDFYARSLAEADRAATLIGLSNEARAGVLARMRRRLIVLEFAALELETAVTVTSRNDRERDFATRRELSPV